MDKQINNINLDSISRSLNHHFGTIKDSAIVSASQQSPLLNDLNVAIAFRKNLKEPIHHFNFNYHKYNAYFSEYLLKGLRLSEEHDFLIVLFVLYLRELAISGARFFCDNDPEYISNLQYDLHQYIKQKHNFSFMGNHQYSSKHFDFTLEHSLDSMKFKTSDEALRVLINLCHLHWVKLFSENIILEAPIPPIEPPFYATPPLYYDEHWLGHIVLNNEKVILTEIGITPTYKRISEIILEKRFSSELISEGEICYLDGDFRNTNEENVVLFDSYSSAMRFKAGNFDYSIKENNTLYFSFPITENEFRSFYPKYSLTELEKICNLSSHYINKKIKEYHLPSKKLKKNCNKTLN